MESKSINTVAREGYKIYGGYVNNSRHIPLIFDGLKPSYRRTIFAALQLCGNQNKFIKSAQLSGYVIGNLHPHGDASIDGVINELVHAGILEGQGNFGGATIMGEEFQAAASRYTEVRVAPNWHAIFNDLLPFVEWEDSYIGVKMPAYLPTPIPLSLLSGSIGIGFGAGCLIPNFAAKSIVEAFKSDDPYKLYPAYRDVTFDYSMCDFENMWNTGYAKITYIPIVQRGSAPDCGDGIYVKSDPMFLIPNLDSIKDKVAAGRLFTRDESDENGDKIFIGRYSKLQEDMDAYVKSITRDSRKGADDMYRLYVTNGKTTKLISLRNWISFTYHRYLGYIEEMKKKRISRIDKEIRVLEILPEIGKAILDNPRITEPEVLNMFGGYNQEDVKACLGKPIRKLMKSDYQAEIDGLKAQRQKIEAINPEEYTLNILNKM